jgi:hypothetical protein
VPPSGQTQGAPPAQTQGATAQTQTGGLSATGG